MIKFQSRVTSAYTGSARELCQAQDVQCMPKTRTDKSLEPLWAHQFGCINVQWGWLGYSGTHSPRVLKIRSCFGVLVYCRFMDSWSTYFLGRPDRARSTGGLAKIIKIQVLTMRWTSYPVLFSFWRSSTFLFAKSWKVNILHFGCMLQPFHFVLRGFPFCVHCIARCRPLASLPPVWMDPVYFSCESFATSMYTIA